MIQMRVALALAVVLCFGSLMARADSETILSVSRAGLSTPIGGNDQTAAEVQFVGIEFELDHPFHNVAITIANLATFGGSFPGTAWLTDAVGPFATPADVIASKPFNVVRPGPGSEDYTFLSNLDLSRGSYYFFLTQPICFSSCDDGLAEWPAADATSTVHTAPGVSFVANAVLTFPGCSGVAGDPAVCAAFNSISPPAWPWDFVKGPPQYAIDITRDIPEPETIVLFLTGLLLIGLSRLQRRAFKRK